MKHCNKCNLNKEETEFAPSQLKLNSGWCKSCVRVNGKKWAEEHPERMQEHNRKHYQENKEKVNERSKKWKKANPEKARESEKKWRRANPDKEKRSKKKWAQENPDKVLASKLKSHKKRYHTDPVYRVRWIASAMVKYMLKSQGSSKNGESSSDYFPWTPEELWNHLLECMKQPGNEWMNENNYGKYIKTGPNAWDDNNPDTWRWQIDHIIPHSDLPYDSMDHPNFKKAWSLSNLRPLSAKQNVLDGVQRTRHIDRSPLQDKND